MTLPTFTVRPAPPIAETPEGWQRLLADVTGRPTFTTPLIAALSRPAPVELDRSEGLSLTESADR